MTVRRFIYVLVLLLVISPAAVHAAADSAAVTNEAVHSETTVPEDATAPSDVAGPAAATPEAQDPVHAAETHGEGGLPQLNIGTYPSQIFWLLVMFVVLYTAFSKSVLPKIGGVVNARDTLIKGNLDAAQTMRDQAEAIRTAYEQNLDRARADAIKAVQDVELAAKKKAADQVETFRKRAETDIKSAEDRVLAVRDGAMGQMKSVAAEVASIAAEKITGVPADRTHANQIVESLAGKAKAA